MSAMCKNAFPRKLRGFNFLQRKNSAGLVIKQKKPGRLLLFSSKAGGNSDVVGEVGLEPTRLIQPADFKSAAYTNSATRPCSHGVDTCIITELQVVLVF